MPEPTNQTTIIGPDTTLKGELTFENSARIMGRVEGKVSSKGEVTIGDGAACKATIDAGRVLVDGVVEGNITAKEKVQLNAKARVVGDITAMTLVVSEGASFTGHCRVGADTAGAWIEDLGSTNGSYVNGERVQRRSLRDGDRLRVGNCELKFFGEGSSEAGYHRELLNHAVYDELTGFYNRRQSREMLEHAFDRGRSEPSRLRLMILDLDHFKQVNDTHG
ncbi:MAG: polymer-forming cytoskeletal protein, partial [Phycisphaerales bacterium]|nr:polymer-forming cytoskeletal protein [Phycisphaerales bacterium]